MHLEKAKRKQAKIKLSLAGSSGCGKTYSALLMAYGLLQAKVFEAESDLLKAGLPVTIHTIGNKIQGKETIIREKMILEVFQYHNDQFEKLAKSGEFSFGTFKKFKSAYNSLVAFIS
jgi:ABC-type dipeptide/oligopeptide/nickel transport system ATPase component